ncbi:MAG: outer membrane protein transport protein [Candidatus Glassbacteria bacterium]|nr:outer membrane protein transport protein [Candidatus Glassbacteria bacterium]
MEYTPPEKSIRLPGGCLLPLTAGVLTFFLLSGAAELAAQSFWRKNDRNTFIRNIQFNFNIPSARGIGLGGAFVAVADDATAGMANPAGLTVLTKPEISVHYKLSRFSHTENVGNQENHDLRREFADEVASQSYLSLVYPHGKWSFSVYRQELINFESSFEAEGFGSIFDSWNLDPDDFEPGNKTRSDILVNNWGTAFAYRPDRRLSLGVSVIVSTLEFRYFENLFQRSGQTGRPLPIFNVTSNSSDTRCSINLGAKYQPAEFLSVGAVYRSGPKFRIVNTVEDVDLDYESGKADIYQAEQKLVFKVPDVYSFGAAIRPLNNLMVSFDIVRVEYSDLVHWLDRNLKEDDEAVYLDRFPWVEFVDGDGVEDLILEDCNEIHLGLEYHLFFRDFLIPLRAGFYTDPSHVVYTTVENEALQRLFPKGDDEIHGTFGLGFVLQNKIQVDLAGNFSKSVSEVLISAVFRF